MEPESHSRWRSVLLATPVLVGLIAAFAIQLWLRAVSTPAEVFLLILRWLGAGALVSWAMARRTLTAAIFTGMIIGALLGHDAPAVAPHIAVLRDIFLRLIKTIIAPLIFSTLVVGVAGHSDLKKVGRMGIKAILYFELVTTIALLIGLAAINISKAGIGVHLGEPAAVSTQPARPSVSDLILHAFPENIARSVAEGQVLQVVVFSLIFAISLALVKPEKRRPMLAFCESLAEVMFKFTNIVMWFAPFAVAAALAVVVAQTGMSVLGNLAVLLVTMYIALAIFVVAVLFPIALLVHAPIRKFIKAVAEPASIAFATSSSEAALPRAMEAMEAIGVPRETVAFVIPTGYSFNLDGSTLYLALASIFVAQAAGMHMGIGQQVVLMLTLMLASKGVAGVARAALVVLLGVAGQFHLPTGPIFVLMGIDQFMDMGRTALNVIGNCLASVVVSRWEGDFGKEATSPVVMGVATE